MRRLGKHILAEANARMYIRAVFSVVRASHVAMQRCCKHISAAVNQHATKQEAGASPRLYNENLTQTE
jgi:hypothetical protein